MINRRQALEKLSGGLLLALGLWPGALRASDAARDGRLKFIVVNDTHLMSDACAEWLRGVIQRMKEAKPDFCLHLGDLTEYGKREHHAVTRDVFQELGCPVHAVPGNHDYNSPKSLRYYNLFFPRRRNYVFEFNGWQFVGLDTTEGQKYEKTRIQPDTLEWADKQAPRLDQRRPTIIFTHFPLGAGVKYRPLNADELLEKFKLLNLQVVFSGHWHGYTERRHGDLRLYTNKCCALKRSNHDRTPEKGFWVAENKDGQIHLDFIEVPCPKPEPARKS